ncbi:MAG: APC family permease [Saprospiraceae bacterium]|nr:APC family permease [Saprospiraceae bacterium]
MSSTGLNRSLSLPLLIFYGVGTILGLGIYVLVGKISGEAGMLSPFAFLIAAILAGFTGLSYGELSSRIPKSAGEVNYVDKAFGNFGLSTSVGWLIIISAIISTSTVVNGYVGYTQIFLDWPPWLIITLITTILGGVAVWGIRQSAFLITIITIIEILGILIVVYAGADHLSSFPSRWPELLPAFKWSDWEAIAAGTFLAFFTFIGFEDLVNVSEEAKNPERDMPKAIIISLVILTFLYMVVALIANFALSQTALDQSDAPLADIVAEQGSFYPRVIGIVSLVAIVNGVLVQIIMCSRVAMGMAKIGMAPSIMKDINPSTQTPLKGTIMIVAVILALALLFELEGLAKATNYVLLLVFMFVNLSLIVIKRRDPDPEGVRTFSPIVPYLGFIFSLVVFSVELISNFTN